MKTFFLNTRIKSYPVLFYAAFEAIGLGLIYGVKNLSKDIKMMSGQAPSILWKACFLVLTPAITVLILIFQIVANTEVKLDKYSYPTFAHVLGWIIVVGTLSPLPIGFFMEYRKRRNFKRVRNSFRIAFYCSHKNRTLLKKYIQIKVISTVRELGSSKLE